MNSVNKKKWYVLYTAPRAEKKVKERLLSSGIDCWLPLHLTSRVWSDRIKKVEVPLFPSYIFVYCEESELLSLLRIYGVIRIVYYSGKPAVVQPKEIKAIEEFLEEAADYVLCTGDEVEILCGAMKNVSGKIRKIKKNYLVLCLEQLDATVCVKKDEVIHVSSTVKC